MHAGTMRGLTVGSESTVAAAAPKPGARRPAAAKKAIVLSDSEDETSDGGLELDDRWVAASRATSAVCWKCSPPAAPACRGLGRGEPWPRRDAPSCRMLPMKVEVSLRAVSSPGLPPIPPAACACAAMSLCIMAFLRSGMQALHMLLAASWSSNPSHLTSIFSDRKF